jgi:hypothetical protein
VCAQSFSTFPKRCHHSPATVRVTRVKRGKEGTFSWIINKFTQYFSSDAFYDHLISDFPSNVRPGRFPYCCRTQRTARFISTQATALSGIINLRNKIVNVIFDFEKRQQTILSSERSSLLCRIASLFFCVCSLLNVLKEFTYFFREDSFSQALVCTDAR